jgi:hypothetical protein
VDAIASWRRRVEGERRWNAYEECERGQRKAWQGR